MYILNPNFGNEVKSARKQRQLTQTQLAEILNISPRYLQAIENEGQMPDYGVLGCILYELGLSVERIFVVKWQPLGR